MSGAEAGPVLGIDTGGPRADLAVVAGGRVLAEASHSVASHGAELPEAVAELLGRAGLSIRRAEGYRNRESVRAHSPGCAWD